MMYSYSRPSRDAGEAKNLADQAAGVLHIAALLERRPRATGSAFKDCNLFPQTGIGECLLFQEDAHNRYEEPHIRADKKSAFLSYFFEIIKCQ
jgi:hypothetical protein